MPDPERPTSLDWGPPRPWIIAHRGALLDAPENTIAAFDLAVVLGADLIELDVRCSADGHLLVIHDALVDRTTDGRGTVSEMDLDALRLLDAGRRQGAAFVGERIPTLAEVLELTRGRVALAIEVKNDNECRSAAVASELIRLLRETRRLDDTIVISRSCSVVLEVRASERRLRTGCFLHSSFEDWRQSTDEASPSSWHSDYLFRAPDLIDAALVEEAHRGGLGLVTRLSGALSEANDGLVLDLLRSGIDGIIADDLAGLLRLAGRSRTPPPSENAG